MTWELTDPDGNRQGITIAEFGEVGGPGVGGCPQGPTNQAAPVGTASVIHAPGSSTAQLKWTPATPQPGAEPVSGLPGQRGRSGQRRRKPAHDRPAGRLHRHLGHPERARPDPGLHLRGPLDDLGHQDERAVRGSIRSRGHRVADAEL